MHTLVDVLQLPHVLYYAHRFNQITCCKYADNTGAFKIAAFLTSLITSGCSKIYFVLWPTFLRNLAFQRHWKQLLEKKLHDAFIMNSKPHDATLAQEHSFILLYKNYTSQMAVYVQQTLKHLPLYSGLQITVPSRVWVHILYYVQFIIFPNVLL